jgi:hypothetical protein
MYVIILTKIGLGYISGEFFPNSSGHPETNQQKLSDLIGEKF